MAQDQLFRQRQQQELAQQQQQQNLQQQQNAMMQQQAPDQMMQLRQEETVLTDLLGRFHPAPDAIPVNPLPAPPANAGKKERKRHQKVQRETLAAEYKEIAAHRDRFLTPGELARLKLISQTDTWKKVGDKKLSHSDKTLRQTVNDVNQGDYSNFENLDPLMRNMTAQRALTQFRQRFGTDGEPKDICQQLQRQGGVAALMDPALRLGLSLAQNSSFTEAEKTFFRQLDEEMSAAIMVETLTHKCTAADLQGTPLAGDAQNAIQANQAQQIQIAKRLLLMHLGRLKEVNQGPDGETSTDWSRPVAVALSHCSRVMLTMPRVVEGQRGNTALDQQRMWQSIYFTKGANGQLSNDAQDNKRASSTHDLKRRKVDARGGVDEREAEKKVKFNFSGQQGMNCAIGGLGNQGISGQRLLNNGSCGHFYSMHKEGDLQHHGAMLMGLESDAAGVTNQMGHTHDWHATAEKASSLGGQRTDEVGMKYGGRQCDLSHMTATDIALNLDALERAMRFWQQSNDPAAMEDQKEVMRMLSGKLMSMAEITGMMDWLKTAVFMRGGERL